MTKQHARIKIGDQVESGLKVTGVELTKNNGEIFVIANFAAFFPRIPAC